MCTVILLRRPGHDWPLLLAANRDEMAGRAWQPPGRHWADRAEVTAGLDALAGGSWLGVNDTGVVAAILNRRGSLGPDPEKRSRGEVVLDALDHADAAAAAEALSELAPQAYRSFNLVIADNTDAYWLANTGGDRPLTVQPVPEGLSVFTHLDMNDPDDPRRARYAERFAAAPPEPGTGDFSAWAALLADTGDARDPLGALNIDAGNGYGTVSSSLIALPSVERRDAAPIWLFAAGAPDRAEFAPVGGLAPAARAD